MGISGLLPLLKSIHRPTELKKFSGETLAVDAYGWLHRGAISCAVELAQGKPTRKYIDFAMFRVRMAKHFGVTPYLVFDGDFLPSKAGTEASRAKRREESRKAGMELLKAGKPSQAYQELQKAIDVTPEMARQLIEELKKMGLPYVVAPYEADAQMVYLERQGVVSGIISEDSDLLVFGAKRLLTKLDQHGQCVEINRRDFCACREISLTGWTDREFRHMAILSGCDYLDGIGNMGLKTAYRMIRKHKTPEKIVRMLQFDGKFKVSENYMAAFKQAELTFLHQRVFCPKKRKLVLLTEPDSGLDVENMVFIGHDLDQEVAQAIAVGDINPMTKEPIVVASPPSKKRRISGHVAAPAAPVFQTRASGKSIEAYFKKPHGPSHRIPMGEMDPNCFAVDAQQVAALTQNGLAPRVFPLPRPYVDGVQVPQPISSQSRPYSSAPRLRRRTEPVANLLGLESDSLTARRQTIAPTVQTPAEPTLPARPPKKARLCEDAFSEGSSEKLVRSKFFPVRAEVKPQSTKRRDTILMSDDSIDEALRSLPDVDSWGSTKPRQSLDIFREDTQATLPADGADEAIIPRSDGIDLPESPCRSTFPDADERAITPAKTSFDGRPLRSFSYAPKPPANGNGTRVVHGLPTPDSSFQEPTSKQALPATESTPLMTPLQRMGAQALGRGGKSASPFSVPSKTTAAASQVLPAKKRHSLGGKPGVPLFPVNPSFVPLPRVDLDEVEALNRPLGSEDQIIPDSDGENDPEDLGCSPVKSGSSRLDLSRFLYA